MEIRSASEMKILIFSDLHLCDTRNSREYEADRLRRLAGYIRSCGAGAVLNLGDTVSRKEFLREEFSCEAGGFDSYLKWREQFDLPFIECSVDREFDFFADKLKQDMDSCRQLDRYMSIITVAPKFEFDHTFSDEQVDFLINAVQNCNTPAVLIASHVPYPGSCSREIAPGIFLNIPENLRRAVEMSDKKVLWCGGHFHWQEEEPRQFGSLTAFYGGRFNFEQLDKSGYMRMVDSETCEVSTCLRDFNW